jgi:hypothetical protein
MVNGKKVRRRTELRIAFDTNTVLSSRADYLIGHELKKLIKGYANHRELSVSWHLPEVVQHEREYQMRRSGSSYLEHLPKLERLLRGGLRTTREDARITEDLVHAQIRSNVEEEVSGLPISLLRLDWARVDWERLMLNAAYRRPPFDSRAEEKGFRDALILESFMQLVDDAPVSPLRCQIGLVCNDTVLCEAISTRSAHRKNVRLYRNIRELQEGIETLLVDLADQAAARLRKAASKLFFVEGDPNCLFEREDLAQRIRAEYGSQFDEVPHEAERRKNCGWEIGETRFEGQEQDRLLWTSEVRLLAEAFGGNLASSLGPCQPGAASSSSTQVPTPLSAERFTGDQDVSPWEQVWNMLGALLRNYYLERQEVRTQIGEYRFGISWSAVKGTSNRLPQARVDEIACLGSIWRKEHAETQAGQ